MSYLIDTHIFLWFTLGLPQPKIDVLLKDPKNLIYLSVVSIWEIIIKKQKKKGFTVPENIEEAIIASEFSVLPINLNHTTKLQELDQIHKDPFDRMLISQARVEDLILVTADRKIWQYRENILRA